MQPHLVAQCNLAQKRVGHHLFVSSQQIAHHLQRIAAHVKVRTEHVASKQRLQEGFRGQNVVVDATRLDALAKKQTAVSRQVIVR